ncbi:SH3 domain-containing protein [Leucosporidium creatinivorum]|uniref:SH3 domain-containing protein n=1 Tax=Leucosporidium creatinivorum TaxID=106004 RepID=A0A1Y2G1P7_9BASI|nr:SH3 domain-containing protein [Leucosporidium creatinivorum]
MERFNSLASQAKAKAEQGRVAGMSRVDNYRNRSASGSSPANDSPAPAPPSRSGHVPSPPTRGGSQKGVFVGIDDVEKEAFFNLLDDYFASRPQYRELFAGASASAPSAAAPPARRAPPSAPTAAAAPPAPPPRARGLGTATALYAFEGQDSAEDLSFNEGDQILVLEHVSEDWMKGELNGRTGIFPSSYVQMS